MHIKPTKFQTNAKIPINQSLAKIIDEDTYGLKLNETSNNKND